MKRFTGTIKSIEWVDLGIKTPPAGETGGATGPGKIWGAAGFRFFVLEGQDYVHHLLAITGLLNIGDLTTPAIGQASFSDFC